MRRYIKRDGKRKRDFFIYLYLSLCFLSIEIKGKKGEKSLSYFDIENLEFKGPSALILLESPTTKLRD